MGPEDSSPLGSAAVGGGGLARARRGIRWGKIVIITMAVLFATAVGAVGRAASSAVAAFGTWGGQQFHGFRRRRHAAAGLEAERARFERSVVEQRAGFVEHHLANTSTPASASIHQARPAASEVA